MKRLPILLILLTSLILPTFVFADVVVRPIIIDEVVEARQTIVREVELTNPLSRKLVVYASVNEITVGIDGEIKEFISPVMTDRTNTVTSWIEVTRGRIEIDPQSSVTVPVTFRTHPQAKAGVYYAFVGFTPASKRYQAEAAALRGASPGTLVKLSIEDQSIEALRIKGLFIDRVVTDTSGTLATVQIENLGDVPAIPTGEIIFYSANGTELTSVFVNQDEAITLNPGETTELSVALPDTVSFGRIKANAILEYGKTRASLYDSTHFYHLPLPLMVTLFLGILLISLLTVFLLYRSRHVHEAAHDGHELPLYVRTGHDANPKDHDITITPQKK